jgi:hypothetical protein
MNDGSSFPQRLQAVFGTTGNGVVGLVDGLLGLYREPGLRIDWHADQCRVRLLGAEPQESINVPLPKAVFRAILARVAALCNERVPNSVSPYGGEGELQAGVESPTVFHVVFTNMPDEQRLEVTRIGDEQDAAKELATPEKMSP